MLNPRLFRDAILLGANAQDSLVYHWLQRHGYQIEPFKPIIEKLRPSPELGRRSRISYLIPGMNASKYAYNKSDEFGVSVLDRMDQLAVDAFGDKPALYVANNDRKSPIIDNLSNAKRISVVSHGLNKFDDYTNIYFSPALNRERKHFEMLRTLGFDSDQVHKASAHETAYQAVLRTSLRRPDSTAEVHAIVADEPMARRIGALLDTTNVNRLGDISSKSRNSYTPTQKAQRWTANKLRKAVFAPKSIPESFINEDGIKSGAFEGFSALNGGLSKDQIIKPDLYLGVGSSS